MATLSGQLVMYQLPSQSLLAVAAEQKPDSPAWELIKKDLHVIFRGTSVNSCMSYVPSNS